jgi:hypothetical protein
MAAALQGEESLGTVVGAENGSGAFLSRNNGLSDCGGGDANVSKPRRLSRSDKLCDEGSVPAATVATPTPAREVGGAICGACIIGDGMSMTPGFKT